MVGERVTTKDGERRSRRAEGRIAVYRDVTSLIMDGKALDGTVESYRQTFAAPPWNESFDPQEVRGELLRVLRLNGATKALLIKKISWVVVANRAGGFLRAGERTEQS